MSPFARWNREHIPGRRSAMELLSALQALLWNRAEHIGLRLAPRWPSGGLSAAFLLCVINLHHPYEAGFAMFCALAALMGSLAGAAGGWLRRKK